MTRIQLRRGTTAEWTTANPVLAAGEAGIELDTDRHKLGDGVRPWSALPYFLPESKSMRVTHPNVDDVLVQVWDAGKGRWQTVHYDSGWRDVGSLLLGGWTGFAHLRRTTDTVDISLSVTSPPGGTTYGMSILDLPSGFRPHDGIWQGPARNGSTGGQPLLDVATYGTYPVRLLSDAGGGQVHNATLRAGSGTSIPTSLPGVLVSAAPS